MTDRMVKTDVEIAFDKFQKQYADRKAEAARTGKPIPAHTLRWYEKQLEEHRASLKRLGLIIPLPVSVLIEVGAVKPVIQQAVELEDDSVPTSLREAKKKKLREAVAVYNARYREKLTEAQREQQRLVRREFQRKQRQAEREKRAAERAQLRAAGVTLEVHIPSPEAKSLDQVTKRLERKRADERRRSAKKKAKINSCPELRERYLQKERDRARRKRDLKRDPSLATARIIAAEAVIAEAIESGEIDAKERKLCLHSIRLAQSHLSQEERRRLNARRAEQARQWRRDELRIRTLRAKAEEIGWAEKELQVNPVLRGLFDAYISRSVNSTIWYKKQHRISYTARDIEVVKEQRTFLLLLNLDADHEFLYRIDEMRKQSLRESGKKQWLKIKSNPELYAKVKLEAKEQYAKKKLLERESGLKVVFEEMSAESEFENWLELYRAARKKMPKI
jgi:hypothetical protein